MNRTALVLFLLTVSTLGLSNQARAAAGDLDPLFGNGGVVVYPAAPTFWYLQRAVVQPSGKIVFGLQENFVGYAALQRLNADGSFDTSFGIDGTLYLGESGILPFTVLLNGKLVIDNGIETVLYSADGQVEGVLYTHPTRYISSMETQSDGKILTAGGDYGNQGIARFTRHLPTGQLDPSFGTNGAVTLSGEGYGIAIYQLPSGSYLVTTNLGSSNAALIKLTADGQRDITFGNGGRVDLPNNELGKVVAHRDGKFLLYGIRGASPNVRAVVRRFNSTGALDGSFANNGELSIDTGSYFPSFFAEWLAARPNGDIILAVPSGIGFRVMKYNPNGLPDVGFGINGSAYVPGDAAVPIEIKLVSQNKILISGIGFGGNMFARLNDSVGAPYDFDNDGKTDIGVIRGSDWWINASSNGTTSVATLGVANDVSAPADFTGDGKTDVAVFSPNDNAWHILRSDDLTTEVHQFGSFGDRIVPRDYDGDGKEDIAVFRPSDRTWWIRQSRDGLRIVTFGLQNDLPVPGDYDGDSKTDIAVFRPSDGTWWIDRTSAGSMVVTFGTSTDKLVPGDYTGDGQVDVAVWRPSNGNWYVLRSENASYFAFPWGTSGDVPAPGDYDGDGRFDAAVFRAGTWYVNRTTGAPLITAFGLSGDRPIPGSYIP